MKVSNVVDPLCLPHPLPHPLASGTGVFPLPIRSLPLKHQTVKWKYDILTVSIPHLFFSPLTGRLLQLHPGSASAQESGVCMWNQCFQPAVYIQGGKCEQPHVIPNVHFHIRVIDTRCKDCNKVRCYDQLPVKANVPFT